MNKPIEIAKAINKLDTFFEFSDSNLKWELEHRNLEKIKTFLRNNKDTIKEIRDLLNNIGEVNYRRYLNGYS